MNEPHKCRGPKAGCKFTPEQRAFTGRVMSRCRAKPIYMTLAQLAEVWGISKHWASQITNAARGY